jgi:hypothetical protein
MSLSFLLFQIFTVPNGFHVGRNNSADQSLVRRNFHSWPQFGQSQPSRGRGSSMASSKKCNRAHLTVTAYQAIDRARLDAVEDDPLMPDIGRETELPYYVELVGEYSIRDATAADWDGEVDDNSPWNDKQPARQRGVAQLQLLRSRVSPTPRAARPPRRRRTATI